MYLETDAESAAQITFVLFSLLFLIGLLVLWILWRLEHPRAKFFSWIRCTVARSGYGHLPIPTPHGHRCAFCEDALHPNDLDDVSSIRHTYIRGGGGEPGSLNRGEELKQPSQSSARLRVPYTYKH